MLRLLGRSLRPPLKQEAPAEGLLGGPTVNMLLVAHPAPDLVPKSGLGAGLEKEDPIVLPARGPAVQSQTPIPLDLGLDHTLHQRKDIAPVPLGGVPAPRPVPPLDPLPLCPAPLPGGEGGTPIPLLTLALGVAPGRGLSHLRGEHSGTEAEDSTGPTMVTVQMWRWTRNARRKPSRSVGLFTLVEFGVR